MANTSGMLIGALIATAACLVFRVGLWSFEHEAKVLTRKGIDPDSMPDRRARLLTSRANLWFFGALAVVLWALVILNLVL